jgi:hypothetical protein
VDETEKMLLPVTESEGVAEPVGDTDRELEVDIIDAVPLKERVGRAVAETHVEAEEVGESDAVLHAEGVCSADKGRKLKDAVSVVLTVGLEDCEPEKLVLEVSEAKLPEDKMLGVAAADPVGVADGETETVLVSLPDALRAPLSVKEEEIVLEAEIVTKLCVAEGVHV